MSDIAKNLPPLPELLKQTVEQFGISTEVTNVDFLLAGEASRHFPEPRNRRRQDTDAADIRRLRSLHDAMKRDAVHPDPALEHENAPVHSEFYKQF